MRAENAAATNVTCTRWHWFCMLRLRCPPVGTSPKISNLRLRGLATKTAACLRSTTQEPPYNNLAFYPPENARTCKMPKPVCGASVHDCPCIRPPHPPKVSLTGATREHFRYCIVFAQFPPRSPAAACFSAWLSLISTRCPCDWSLDRDMTVPGETTSAPVQLCRLLFCTSAANWSLRLWNTT